MLDPVSALRQFNRSYTQRIGVLEDSFLGLDRPLSQSRLLFEVGPVGTAVIDLRRKLQLDSGYMSRLLGALENEGLIEVAADPADRRRRTANLTPAGREAWNELDTRSDLLARRITDGLSSPRGMRLAEYLGEADRLIRAATVEFATVDPLSEDAVESVSRYFAELDRRFPDGFDPGDAIVADSPDFDEPLGEFVCAYSDADLVGCGGIKALDEQTGEIKRMWVLPDWRGLGLGSKLLAELEARVAARRLSRVVLDTNSTLIEAIALYESAGYREIERYNDNPYALHWFEKEL